MSSKFPTALLALRSFAYCALALAGFGCAHAEVEGQGDAPSDADYNGKGGTGGSAGSTSYGGTSYGYAGTSGTGGASGGSASTSSSGGSGTTSGGNGGSAQGGSSGSAGTSASGGSSGSGGTSGNAPVSADGFSVQYKVEQMTNTIGCQLTIKNSGSLTVPLSELTLRYYYTNEISVATVTDVNWAGVNPGSKDFKGQVTSQVVDLTPATSAADSYLEFSFGGSALSVAPNETADLSWQIHASDWSQSYVQTGDYSFDSSKSTLTDWDHVVLLRNGGIIWGAEP